MNELTLMGFPAVKAKKVIAEAKSTALNDLIDLILKELANDTGDSMKSADPKPAVEEKKEYIAYNCEVCTFINEPNCPVCAVCGSPAPAHAIKVTKAAQPASSEQTMTSEPAAPEKPTDEIDEEKKKAQEE